MNGNSVSASVIIDSIKRSIYLSLEGILGTTIFLNTICGTMHRVLVVPRTIPNVFLPKLLLDSVIKSITVFCSLSTGLLLKFSNCQII